MHPFLHNLTWHALSGAHREFSVGTDHARRYASGFSPIVGFADPSRPDFDALRPHCAEGDHLYCEGWSGPAPAGWRIEAENRMLKMLWQGATPEHDAAPEAQRLGAGHAEAALALALLTRPGPFGLRTIELGEYYGLFEDGELVAMAGERMRAGDLHEISGVCTHPQHQGRGLARRLMLKLLHRQRQRGETPMLHVMHDNTGAVGLYERMGFRAVGDAVVRVVAPC